MFAWPLFLASFAIGQEILDAGVLRFYRVWVGRTCQQVGCYVRVRLPVGNTEMLRDFFDEAAGIETLILPNHKIKKPACFVRDLIGSINWQV